MHGACVQCDNVIRGIPVRLDQQDGPTKYFCTPFCCNKHQKKEGSTDAKKSEFRLIFADSLNIL